MNLPLCNGGDWVPNGSSLECTGTIMQSVYSVPVEYTAEMAMEAIFQGFMVAIPVLAVVFGGRQILKMLR